MGKYIFVIILGISFLESCKTKSNEHDFDRITSYNDSIIRKIKVPDPNYSIEIIYLKGDKILYSKSYGDYWHSNSEYLMKGDTILVYKTYGKRATINTPVPGDKNKNPINYYLYKEVYDFRNKNNPLHSQKEIVVRAQDDKIEKSMEFDKAQMKQESVKTDDYSKIYDEFKRRIK